MKKVAMFLAAAVMLVVCLPDLGNAQTSATPTLTNTLYKYNLVTTRQYAASQVDTLPLPQADGTLNTIKGAPNLAGLRFTAADSCTFDIVIKKREIGATAWTTIVTDSLISSTTIVPAKEYVLRNHATDNLVGLQIEYFAIVTFRATGNGNGGKPSTKKYTSDFVWKP